MNQTLTLSKATSARGADYGRPNLLPIDQNINVKMRMEKLKWVDFDYDQNGAYWGRRAGEYIYCAWCVPTVDWPHIDNRKDVIQRPLPLVQVFARAKNRKEAKSIVRELLPNARFFN